MKVQYDEKQDLKSSKNSVDTSSTPLKDSPITLLPYEINHYA